MEEKDIKKSGENKKLIALLLILIIVLPLGTYLVALQQAGGMSQQAVEELEDKIEAQEGLITELKAQLSNMSSIIEGLRAENAEIAAALEGLQAENDQLLLELDLREQEIGALKDSLAQMNVTVAGLRQERDVLLAQLREKDVRIAELEAQLVGSEELERLTRQIQILLGEMEEMSSIIQGVENKTIVSVYPWITKKVEERDNMVTVTFFLENNAGRNITRFSLEYSVYSPTGGLNFLSIYADPEFFETGYNATSDSLTFRFELKKALPEGGRWQLTLNYTKVGPVEEGTTIVPEPQSTADKNYNQVNDLLEEELPIAVVAGENIDVVVSLLSPVTDEDREAFQAYGGNITAELPIINGFYGTIPAPNFLAFLDEIQDRLSFIDPNVAAELELATSVSNIRADKVWDLGFKGDPKTAIALIDTGIDANHTSFGGYKNVGAVGWNDISSGIKVVGFVDFATSPPSTINPTDTDGHGSHVAGIAAGGRPPYGVARDAKLVMLHSNRVAHAIQALNWIVANSNTYHIVVTSMSQGYGRTPLPNLRKAVRSLVNHGILFVKSASNDWDLGLGITEPGNEPLAITVGAVNKSNSVVYYSANGPGLDILAPGKDITSVDSNQANEAPGLNNFVSESGTSMAAPHIAGAIALMVDAVTDYDKVDEDGDGLVDEDPWDWVDNDGDGLIDEDLAPWKYERKFGYIDMEIIDDRNYNGRYDAGDVIINEGNRPGIQSFYFYPLALRLEAVLLMTASEVQKGEKVPSNIRWIDINGNGRTDQRDLFFVDGNGDGRVTFSDGDGDGTFDGVESFLGPSRPRYRAINHGSWREGFMDFDGDGIRDANEPSFNRTSSPNVMLNDPSFPLKPPTAGKENKPPLDRWGWDPVEGYGMVSADAAIEALTKTLCSSAEDILGSNPSDKKVWAAHVYLYKDARYKFKLDVPSGADFDLYVYFYFALPNGHPIILKMSVSEGAGKDEFIELSPPEDGIYIIVVKQVSGSGKFKLEMETRKRLTVMFYMAADAEGLDQPAFSDLNEIERAGPSGRLNLLAQVDWHVRNQSKVHRLVFTPLRDDRTSDRWKEHLTSLHTFRSSSFQLCEELDESSTGNPDTLLDFLNYTVRYYPADNYVLVLWGDGDGWKANEAFGEKGSGLLADSHPNPDSLTMKELREVLQKYMALKQGIGGGDSEATVPKLGLIFFDSPLMATVEVAREVGDYALYMVASQGAWKEKGYEPPTKAMDEEPKGWNYTSLIAHIKEKLDLNPSYTPRQLAMDIPSLAKDSNVHTASAIDLSALKILVEVVSNMGDELGSGTRDYQTRLDPSDNVAERLRINRMDAETFGGVIDLPKLIYAHDLSHAYNTELEPLRFTERDPVWGDMDYIDLYHFTSLVVNDPLIPEKYKGSARQVLSFFPNVVIAEYHASLFQNAHGLSIYFPYQQTRHIELTDAIDEFDYDSPMELSQYGYSDLTFTSEATGWPFFLHLYWIPVADIGFDYKVVAVGESVIFDGRGSSDTDASREFVDRGFVPEYLWDFGDGGRATSQWFDSNNDGAIDAADPLFATDGAYDGVTRHAYGRPGVYHPVLEVVDEDAKKSADPAKVVVVVLPDVPTYPDDPVTPPTEPVPTEDGAGLIDDFVRFELTKISGLLSEEVRIQLIDMADQIHGLIEEGAYEEAKSLAVQAQGIAGEAIQDEDLRDAISGSFGEIARFMDYAGEQGQASAYAVVQVSEQEGSTTITVKLVLHYVYEGENVRIETTITFINTLILHRVQPT